mgnify:CR=1 FL=1
MNKPLIRYPFPLNQETMVYFELPEKLTKKDIKRIKKYLITLIEGEKCDT